MESIGNAIVSGLIGGIDIMLVPFAAAFGGLALQISSAILAIIGIAFEYVLDASVISFGTFYAQYFKTAVETIWVVFRDVANIGIIGAFVFVAIATILGSDSYGVKRFIARLLIAAVLINFSIFFTKITIDISHLIAIQFYKAIQTQNLAQQSTNLSSGENAPTEVRGVAGTFMDYMGTSGYLGSVEVIKSAGFSSFKIVLLTSLATILSCALIIILGYGMFLLVARVVILIFLLTLSSLAFASIAIPKLTGMWDKWLKTLLTNLFFAPLLMMMLWATLTIGQNMAKIGGGKTFTDLINSPNGGSMAVLFNFMVLAGLLFASIHFAKSMSFAGASRLPSLKALSDGSWGGYKAMKSMQNLLRYSQSRYATGQLNGAKGTQLKEAAAAARLRGDMVNAKNLDAKIEAMRKKSAGEFPRMFAGQRDSLDKVAKVLKEGAGKGGYAKTASDAAKKEREKLAQDMANQAPNRQEKKREFDDEVAIRAGEKHDDPAVRKEATELRNLKKQRLDLEDQMHDIAEKERGGALTKKQASDQKLLKQIELNSNADRIQKARVQTRINLEEMRKTDAEKIVSTEEEVKDDFNRSLAPKSKKEKDALATDVAGRYSLQDVVKTRERWGSRPGEALDMTLNAAHPLDPLKRDEIRSGIKKDKDEAEKGKGWKAVTEKLDKLGDKKPEK